MKGPNVKKAAESQSRWHPNFRDASSLPDIKPVRTRFFISALAILLACASLIGVSFGEYHIKELKSLISAVEQGIEENQGSNAVAARQNNAFRDLVAKIDALEAFDGNQLAGSEFLMAVGRSLPEGVVLSSVVVREAQIGLAGEIGSASGEAAAAVDNYISALKEVDAGQGKYLNYSLKSLARNNQNGLFNFDIELSRAQK